MTNFLKNNRKRLFHFVSIVGIIGSIILIIFNISLIEQLQIQYRNDIRVQNLQSIANGVEKFINEKNNCPRTSNPVPQTFLPELIFETNDSPSGGVSVSSLEDINNYVDINMKDPGGSPYFIGITGNKIVFYTLDYEVQGSAKKAYFVSISTSLCSQI